MPFDIDLTLFAIVLLLALSAFFNGSETALTAASRARMHALEGEGNSRAGLVNRILSAPEKMIGSVLLGNTLVDVLAAALAANLATQLVGEVGVVYATVIMTMLIVIFSGYENFVSKFDLGQNEDRPDWMGTVDFSGLKLKLIASIVAISGIALLKAFLELEKDPEFTADDERRVLWQVIVHLTFVASGVLLAFMDWLTGHQKPEGNGYNRPNKASGDAPPSSGF